MTRPTDPRGANRRGSGWGDDIGYSNDRTTRTPALRHVAQTTEPTGTPATMAWHTVRLDTGECVQVYPLQHVIPERVEWGGKLRRVVEVLP